MCIPGCSRCALCRVSGLTPPRAGGSHSHRAGGFAPTPLQRSHAPTAQIRVQGIRIAPLSSAGAGGMRMGTRWCRDPLPGCMRRAGILAQVTVPAQGSDDPSGCSCRVKHKTISSMILILVLAVTPSDV